MTDKLSQWFWGQIVALGFETKPRNPRSSSPCARCKPHTVSPDFSIVRPLSTQPVRLSLVLYTMSPTPAMIFIAARHATPVTCTPREFKFKPRQVNYSSQLNQGTDHLVSQFPILWMARRDRSIEEDLLASWFASQKLAVFALGDNFYHVVRCHGPIETMPEGLAYDRAPWWMDPQTPLWISCSS
jgi:hypothetical protein